MTWNENGVLTGARHVTLAGHYAYIIANAGLVVVDLTIRSQPRLVTTVPLTDGRASALQFRYLWVTTADGLQLFDVTNMEQPGGGARGDGAARRRPPRLSRPHLRLCRGGRRRPGHRQRHPADPARRSSGG